MALKDQIDQIVDARKAKGEALKKRRDTLVAMKAALKENCSALAVQVRSIPDDKLRAQYAAVFSMLDSRKEQNQIDNAIRKLDGVEEVHVNFLTQKMVLTADDARFDEIAKEAAKCCSRVDANCRVLLKG